MILSEAVSAITSAMTELQLDRKAVEATGTALNNVVKALDKHSFDTSGVIERESFGGNTTATTLSWHHGRAHQVMSDTLDGILKDIEAFTVSLVKAADLVEGTDANAAADLAKKQALLEQLHELQSHSHGDQAHDESRNDVRNPWANDGGDR